LLLSLPSLSDDILAKPGLSQDHGCFLADGWQRASNPRTKRLTSLLLADGVLDEQRGLAACEFANAEAGQLVVKLLDLGLAFQNLQGADELIIDLCHDDCVSRNEKVRSVVLGFADAC
jgi:hypothetical protein